VFTSEQLLARACTDHTTYNCYHRCTYKAIGSPISLIPLFATAVIDEAIYVDFFTPPASKVEDVPTTLYQTIRWR